ncbi:lamin tail domain-containing protein [Verrucomicrobiota bacterium sgz303538]
MFHPVRLLFGLALLSTVARGDVVINELMYHPPTENPAEEWVELYNSGGTAVDVSGWQFTSGVQFTIPAGKSIAPGGYLVIAADASAFAAKYPGVSNYVAGWSGRLSNSSNKLTLRDTNGTVINAISYADDGNWAARQRDIVLDYGHRGWGWDSGADGFGKSLELSNSLFDNSLGQNWRASTTAGGTPGAANSTAVNDIAPAILDVAHFPLVPKSTDTVDVTAHVIDDGNAVSAVRIHYRNDGSATFSSAAMFDDGLHGDAAAGDGVFGAALPAQPTGTIVEFYVEATDAANHTRTWPAPALDENGTTAQTANCLYQVDDTVYAGAMPIYRLVMKAADKQELTQINTNNPSISGVDQTYSHAKMNATFISFDGTGSEVRYLVGVRNRGNGSRSLQPQSFNVSFTNEDPWKGRVSINLNTQDTPYQLLGSALFRKSGLAGPESRQVQLRVNASNPASSANAPAYGFYVCNEVQNNEFADHHFPLDSSGNIYRGQRVDITSPSGKTQLNGANLSYITPGVGEPLSQLELYKLNYFKHTNTSEDDWTDLIGLTQALAKGHSDASFNATYDADYVTAVRARVDVDEWMRFLAANTIADNSETNISSGDGDDYYLYFGVTDPRAKFVPYDLDTILGRSSGSNSATHSIFRMTQAPSNEGSGPTALNAFIKHPQFAPIYYRELKRLLDGPFASANFDPLADQVLSGVVSASVISSMKTFNAQRTAYIATQVPLAISVTSGPTVVNGYPQTTSATVNLSGKANAITTRSVKVNGVAATWTAWNATWDSTNVALRPGINKVLIQAFDENNAETERFTYDVWYDDASVVSASGTLAANTTWTAAGGPYRVSANLVIPAGVTLTIQPGTTVYVASGATIQVNGTGKISAVGTETQRIVFAHEPGATGTTWGSLDFINTTVESTLSYVSFSDCGGTTIGGHNAQCHANNAIVFFDHLYFPPTPVIEFISFDAASFIVQNSYFSTYPAPTGPESLHGVNGIMSGGHGIFRDNYFGHTWGFNDTIDFTGGNRPGPILQVIGNTFDGASDDCLDLDSTDIWVEGNIFMHVHRDPTRTDNALDTGSAISGGVDTVGQNSDWTIINNLFYDVDHVFLNKGNSTTTGNGGGRVAFLYNTVIHVAKENSGSTEAEIGAFDWTDDSIKLPDPSLGSGLYAAHNIITDCSVLQVNYNPANLTVIMENNILPIAWSGAGSGNQVIDPRLNLGVLAGTPVAKVTPGQLLQACQLLPGSPAIGAGFGGLNIGGLQPHGIAIGGEPSGTTNSTSATLTVGPGGTFNWGTTTPQPFGWTAFKWKLDNGAWSSEIPVSNNSPFTSPATINLTGLSNGPHTVYVTGKNDAGYYQDDTFVYPSSSSVPAGVTVSRTWTVDTGYVPPAGQPNVRINEVLAKNAETQGFSGTFPDIVELYNAGSATADISGWGLTDNSSIPYKYTFPANTTLAPGTYLIVYASNNTSVPLPRTGFALKDSGDTLTLTKAAATGGGVADSVAFGAQLTDYSIGRRSSDGQWDLCTPTFGAANIVAAQAPTAGVKINEWLADARTLFSNDFIELYNPAALPVNVGTCYLTDNPVEWTTRHQIRQLTFLAAGGYASFKADGDTDQGPDHLNFKLSPAQGEIGLFSPTQQLIDNIAYGPQSTDISQGRTPNGTSAIAFFNQPTPGAPNPGTSGSTTTTVTLMPAAHPWKYFANATNGPANDTNGKSFIDPAYNDSSWSPTGSNAAQLLYIESSSLANSEGFAKTTLLPGITTTKPYQTYYFRTHFTFNGSLAGTTLTAKIMVDDGCILYLNGQEIVPTNTSARIGMAAGTVTYTTRTNRNIDNATVETFTLPANQLLVGDNVLAVEVHQTSDQSSTSPSSDIVWGMKLDANIPSASSASVVINEVLPINATLQNPDGSLAGWIELFNPSAAAVDISGMSLTNDVADSRRFVFPANTSVPANGYIVITCNSLTAQSPTNTGFALDGAGGGVYLFDAPKVGGGLRDSVVYGHQLPDFSIGRITDGSGAFTLTVPTRGALNSAAGLATVTAVKINEWLAVPTALPGWLELYNTGAQPILLSGNYLTDQLTDRTKYLFPPLSFIGATGSSRWYQLIADNASSALPGHVNFSLNPAGEAIGLFTASGTQLDAVTFGAQMPEVSRGRFPDGSSAIIALTPTPGTANLQAPPDADGDNIPDAWEIANGLNPNDPADAAKDLDGDGQSNIAEYIAGTNPRDGVSALRARVLQGQNPGQAIVRFTAAAGKGYTVRYKNTLNDATWTKLADVPADGSSAPVDVVDNTAGSHPQRFYQVVTPQQP